MKELFKDALKKYLDNRAKKDREFAKFYANPNKNLDECVAFVEECVLREYTSKANKNVAVGVIDDEEAFGFAVHYYNEEDVKPTGNLAQIAKEAGVTKTEATKVATSTTSTKKETKSAPKTKVKVEKKEKKVDILSVLDELEL